MIDDDDDFCYKRVQTPGMSPPRAGAWTYCLFTPWDLILKLVKTRCQAVCKGRKLQ